MESRHTPLPWLLPAEVNYDTDFEWMRYTEFEDQIENYLGGFSPRKLISCFDNLTAEWRRGVDALRLAMAGVPKNADTMQNESSQWLPRPCASSQPPGT